MPGSSPDNDVVASDTGNTVAGSSTETTIGSQDSAGSDSSPAHSAGSMLDAVQAALEPKGESPASEEPGSKSETDSDTTAADHSTAEEELTAEELKALNWKTQTRFKKLSADKKELATENESLRPKAAEFDRIVGSIRKAGLESSELDELVELGSLLKRGDPNEALAKLVPIVHALREVAGEVLSADLQEEVRLGYITEARAKELQRARASSNFATQKVGQIEADHRARQEANEFNELVRSSIGAVEVWERQQAEKDPEWQLKRKEVAELVELAIVRESNKRKSPYFPTPEEGVALSKEALKTVNERMSRFKSRPNEIRPTTPGASPRSKAKPTSMLEAIEGAL